MKLLVNSVSSIFDIYAFSCCRDFVFGSSNLSQQLDRRLLDALLDLLGRELCPLLNHAPGAQAEELCHRSVRVDGRRAVWALDGDHLTILGHHLFGGMHGVPLNGL